MEGKETLKKLEQFQRLSEQIRVNLNPEMIATAFFEIIRNLISVKHVGLYIYKDSQSSFESVGVESLEMLDQALSLHDEGVVNWVFEQDHLIITPSPSLIDVKEENVDNLLVMPLRVGAKRIGIFLANLDIQPDSIDQYSQTLVSLAANQVAIAIKNAYEYNDAENAKINLTRILETVFDVIYTTDEAGLITFANKRVDLFGFKPERLIGQPVYTLLPTDLDDGRTVEVLKNGSSETFDVRMTVKKKEEKLFTVSLVPLRGTGKKITGCLGILRDITESHLLEEESLRRKRLEALTEAAISINHEFNNPLTVIQGNLFLLEKALPLDEKPDLSAIVSTLKKHSQRISEVVKKFEKIHDMSSVEYPGGLKMLNVHGDNDDSENEGLSEKSFNSDKNVITGSSK